MRRVPWAVGRDLSSLSGRQDAMAGKPTFEELEERRRKRWGEALDKTPVDWEASIQPVTEAELEAARRDYKANAEAELARILAKHQS